MSVSIGLADWRLPVNGPEGVYLAAEVGAEGIQLDLGGPERAPWLDNPQRLKAIQNAIADTGVHPLAVSANVMNDIGLCAKSGSPAAKDVLNIISRAIDAASALDVGLVFLPSFRRSEIINHAALIRTAEVLQWACTEAQRRGLLLATENVLTPHDLLKLIRLVDSVTLRVVLDTGNPLKVRQSPLGIVKVAAKWIAPQIHIKSIAKREPLIIHHSIIVDVLNALNNEAVSFNTLVLENDYRDGDIIRMKRDIGWVRAQFISPSIKSINFLR